MWTVAAAYAAATRAGDLDALAGLTEPSLIVWHNFDGRVVDRAASDRTLTWLHRIVPDLTWEDVGLEPTPSGFVWQAVMRGTAPGGPLAAATCLVATLSLTGKVARIDEYVDSAQLACLSESSGGRPGQGRRAPQQPPRDPCESPTTG